MTVGDLGLQGNVHAHSPDSTLLDSGGYHPRSSVTREAQRRDQLLICQPRRLTAQGSFLFRQVCPSGCEDSKEAPGPPQLRVTGRDRGQDPSEEGVFRDEEEASLRRTLRKLC